MPKLRFPEFSGEWQPTYLSNICSYQSKRKVVNHNKYVSTENMQKECNGIIAYNDYELVDGIEFRAEDILLANIRPYLKKLWFASFLGACSTDVLCIRTSNVFPKFIYYLMNNDIFFSYVMSGAKGSKMPRGDKTQIMEYKFHLPDFFEQKKIAAFLTLLDERITKQRELVENLKSYKRGVLSAIFKEISKTKRLGEISTYISSDLAIEEISKRIIGKYPVYDAGGIAAFIDDFKVDEEYIAIIKDGSGVGRLQYCKANSSFIGTLGGIKALNCSPSYLYAAMQMIDFRQYITGATIPHIYYKDYKNESIPFPSLKEQNTIMNISQLFDNRIYSAETKFMDLQLLKAGLLQQLFI